MRYTAAYKKGAGPGELRWVTREATDEREAGTKLPEKLDGYRRYAGPLLASTYEQKKETV